MTGEVWALAGLSEGELANEARELCALAKELGQRLNTVPAAVILADKVPDQVVDQAAAYGVERVYVIDDPAFESYNAEIYTQVLASVLQSHSPYLFLFSHNTVGCEVAPYLAALLERAIAINCIGFQVEGVDGLVVHQRLYEGRAQAQIRLQGVTPYFVTCRPDSFGLPPAQPGGYTERIKLKVEPLDSPRVQRRQLLAGDYQTMDLTEADLVVAGGLGFSTQEELQWLWQLGDLLQASVGVTRPLVDNGWVEFERQIGTTGRVISPKLYIACGISGATQHTSGIVNPGKVVVINTDAGAPMFQMADLGLVGDLGEVLPELMRQLQERRERGVESQ